MRAPAARLIRALVAVILMVCLTLVPTRAGAEVTLHTYLQGPTGVHEVIFTNFGSSTKVEVNYYRWDGASFGGVVTAWLPNTMVYPNNWLAHGSVEYGIPAVVGFCWWISSDRWAVLPWANPSVDQGWASFDTWTGAVYPQDYSDINTGVVARDWVYGPGGKPCARLLLY